jgi:hypothetical protein
MIFFHTTNLSIFIRQNTIGILKRQNKTRMSLSYFDYISKSSIVRQNHHQLVWWWFWNKIEMHITNSFSSSCFDSCLEFQDGNLRIVFCLILFKIVDWYSGTDFWHGRILWGGAGSCAPSPDIVLHLRWEFLHLPWKVVHLPLGKFQCMIDRSENLTFLVA